MLTRALTILGEMKRRRKQEREIKVNDKLSLPAAEFLFAVQKQRESKGVV